MMKPFIHAANLSQAVFDRPTIKTDDTVDSAHLLLEQLREAIELSNAKLV